MAPDIHYDDQQLMEIAALPSKLAKAKQTRLISRRALTDRMFRVVLVLGTRRRLPRPAPMTKGKLTASIADQFDLTEKTAAADVRALEDEKLILTITSKTDKRVSEIELSERGEELFCELCGNIGSVISETSDVITKGSSRSLADKRNGAQRDGFSSSPTLGAGVRSTIVGILLTAVIGSPTFPIASPALANDTLRISPPNVGAIIADEGDFFDEWTKRRVAARAASWFLPEGQMQLLGSEYETAWAKFERYVHQEILLERGVIAGEGDFFDEWTKRRVAARSANWFLPEEQPHLDASIYRAVILQ